MVKKTLMMLVLAALFVSANLFAKNFPGDEAGAKADYLYKKLKLTNEQYSKVYSMFLESAMKMDAMMLNKMAPEAKKEQMKKLHDDTMAGIEKMLTKEQLANWPKAKDKVCSVKYKKPVKKVTDSSKEEVKKDEKKDVKKEEKKDVKKEEKKDAKK